MWYGLSAEPHRAVSLFDRPMAFLFLPPSLVQAGPTSLDAFPSILETKQVGGEVSRKDFLEEDVSKP